MKDTSKKTSAGAGPLKGIRALGKPRSMGDVAYDYLKQAIVKGDIPPGQRLIENQLSAQMEVSRVPVREAVKKLEQEGLVERSGVRGFVVKGLNREEIEETLGIRALLESYAAYLATEHITEAILKKLEDSIRAYRKAFEKKGNNTDKLMRLNTQFHEIIYEAAGSGKLYSLINSFRDAIHRYRRPLLACEDYARVSLRDHEEMVKAMRKKDKKRVEALVRKHILRGMDIIIQELDAGKSV
ncbi:MAG TPA: GntR family transcriptional regulator [Syntrophorhabdaceae bacterium]|nr:GntR family transcriptional regulator [Syntrophorhabdaceae bacterium]